MNRMKVEAEIYRGIEFVRISKLPEEQKNVILDHIDHTLLIKILFHGEILSDCIQHEDYARWYDQTFNLMLRPESAPETPQLRVAV